MATIRRLAREDDRSSFTCGQPELDEFFRRQAWQHQSKRASVTYVATEGDQLVGFVTVCPGTLIREDLGPAFRHHPPFPLPILLVARLGVSSSAHRQGIGATLLKHSLRLTVSLIETVGCVGVVVDAKPDSVAFYEKYGFRRISTTVGRFQRLFLPVSAIPPAEEQGPGF